MWTQAARKNELTTQQASDAPESQLAVRGKSRPFWKKNEVLRFSEEERWWLDYTSADVDSSAQRAHGCVTISATTEAQILFLNVNAARQKQILTGKIKGLFDRAPYMKVWSFGTVWRGHPAHCHHYLEHLRSKESFFCENIMRFELCKHSLSESQNYNEISIALFYWCYKAGFGQVHGCHTCFAAILQSTDPRQISSSCSDTKQIGQGLSDNYL